MSRLRVLPFVDSDEMAAQREAELNIPREFAATLGRSAVEAATCGRYVTGSGRIVVWDEVVSAAIRDKRSISPDAVLSARAGVSHATTTVQVTNETTLGAAMRLTREASRPLALNFANGVHPGGGFLRGARAQEEVLCRSSALYRTLVGDPMYDEHRKRHEPDSTDWTIYSPDVPVFRLDDGTELEDPWTLSFITCAAPEASAIGQPRAGDLLRKRIHRLLDVAASLGHSSLVLGAWGCGAFANDSGRTAMDFRDALASEKGTAFSEVVFAITDWSPERRFLGPFRDAFGAATRSEA